MRFMRLPSPAMLVAVVGLLVALGGTSIAQPVVSSAAALITGKRIKDSSVTSKDVKNGSLVRKDFKKGQAPQGARGPAGPQGPAGPAGPQGPQGPQGAEGTAKAYAWVYGADGGGIQSNGNEIAAKGISSFKVLSQGVYCFHDLAFDPKVVSLTPDYSGSSLPTTLYADIVPTGVHPEGCKVVVRAVDGSANPTDAEFYIVVN
jgi:hypothetical protein